jgi:hypothetical protein
MSTAPIVVEGFLFATHFVVTEGFLSGTPIPPTPPPAYNALLQHGGQGRRRWDKIRTVTKERPDDEVLADHVAALVAHLLGLPPSRPAPRKAVEAVLASSAALEALDTGQWELAETRAVAAILESKVAGLERQKAILLKRQKDENDDEEAMELILGHA